MLQHRLSLLVWVSKSFCISIILFYLRSTQGRLALGGLFLLFLLYEAVRWITDTAEEFIEDDAVPVD